MLTPQLTSGVREFLLRWGFRGDAQQMPDVRRRVRERARHGGARRVYVLQRGGPGDPGEPSRGGSGRAGSGVCGELQAQKWLYDRQTSVEGGYNGRTNKLVDGCYSWYVGSAIANVAKARGGAEWTDRARLLQYALRMEQNPWSGGLRDKPEMKPDLYHTNYGLCGLSLLGGVLEVGEKEALRGVEKGG